MEQKQLDELNEYQGEEFIDEFVELDDIKIEPVKAKKRGRKPAKASKQEEQKGERKAKEATEEKKIETADVETASVPAENIVTEPPVSEHRSSGQHSSSISSPTLPGAARGGHDPAGEHDSTGGSGQDSWLSRVSTWKAITGLLLILLAFSFFTEGFSFDGASASISPDDAQIKALNFVNTEILPPPLYAEAGETEDVGSLYKVELSIITKDGTLPGQPIQSINSYITKDGALFFPQGFDTDRTLREQLGIDVPAPGQAQLIEEGPAGEEGASTENASAEGREGNAAEGGEANLVEEIVIDGTTGEVTSRLVPADEPAEDAAASDGASGGTFRKALKYWRWGFWPPNTITVKKGQTVELTLGPDLAKKDLALESFTFSLPAFGIEQEIRGISTISFVADKAGEFEFFCSSCEEFRDGQHRMPGTLLVEE